MYRLESDEIEFFLVHPGGPFFRSKDTGVWSIPKGEAMEGEEPLFTAVREFEEETGFKPSGEFIELDPVTQKGGKQIMCWAIEAELDPLTMKSNTFELEWPPKSGIMQSFPENDKAGWFKLGQARKLINERQINLLEQLTARVN